MEKLIEDEPLNVQFGRASFEGFCSMVLKTKLGTMHKEWLDLIENSGKHVCVVAPRGHFKTSTLSIAYPLWIMFRENTSKTILILSASLEQSTEIMQHIKGHIEKNEVLRNVLYPENTYQTKWSETQIRTKNNHRVLCLPFGDSARGKHADLLVCDDILRTEVGTDIESAKRTFYGVVYPTIQSRRGKCVVVGTPASYTDLLYDLSTKSTFIYRKYPAVKVASDGSWIEPIFPEHFDLVQLQAIKETMPSHLWSREYMCEPISDDTSLFPPYIIEPCVAQYEQVKSFYDTHEGSQRFIGCDIAVSDSPRADWSVFSVLEKLPDQPILLRDIVRKHLSTDNNVAEIERLASFYSASKVYVEENGVGWGVAEKCSKSPTMGKTATPFDTRHKVKERLVSRLEVMLRNKQIALPRNELLISELSQFGIKQGRDGRETFETLGTHDDMVISLCIALEAANSAVPATMELV